MTGRVKARAGREVRSGPLQWGKAGAEQVQLPSQQGGHRGRWAAGHFQLQFDCGWSGQSAPFITNISDNLFTLLKLNNWIL